MMTRPIRIAGLLLIAALAAPQAPAATAGEEAARLLEELASPDDSKRHIGTLLGGPAAGISVAVAVRGEIVFSRGAGYADLENQVPATPATVYRVGSVSKVMAAVAVMQLVEQGKVGLQDPIRRHVPFFPPKRSPITIWNIMTHTSGIRHYADGDFPNSPSGDNVMPVKSLEEGIRIFKDDPLLFEPGRFYKYSSFAVNLLQGVIESAGEADFETYMKRKVWEPAGMERTGVDIPSRVIPGRARGYGEKEGVRINYPYADLTYKFAGGGMISTAEDLVRFGLAVARGRLLEPKTVEAMFEPQLHDILAWDDRGPLRWTQSLMWRIRKDEEGRPYVHHCGYVAGFNACLIIYQEEDLIAAVADNAGVTGLSATRAFARLFSGHSAGEPGGTR